jgi:hypothetical protein
MSNGLPLHICSVHGCHAFTDKLIEDKYLCDGHREVYRLQEKIAKLSKELKALKEEYADHRKRHA